MSNFRWIVGSIFSGAGWQVTSTTQIMCLADNPVDVPTTIPQTPLP
jgi:hypothetical protein